MAKETKEEKEMTGVCRFCYQTRIIKGRADMTEEEITEEATRSCDCEAAETYRIRMKRLEKAKKNIEELFGENAGGFAQRIEIKNLMECGVDVINDGDVRGITINLNKGLKCKIAVMADDRIKVSREAKFTEERKQ